MALLLFLYYLQKITPSLCEKIGQIQALKKLVVFHSISLAHFRILVFRLSLRETFFLLFLCSSILCLMVLAWLSGPRTYVGRVGPAKEGYWDTSSLASQCPRLSSLSCCLLDSFLFGLSQAVVCKRFFFFFLFQLPVTEPYPTVPPLGEWSWFRFPLSILANIAYRSGQIRGCIKKINLSAMWRMK